jgi:MOSC domain-containing protein YiiM
VLEIVSVNVAQPSVLLRWSGGEVVSAIDKRPVSGEVVELGETNLDGDAQSDTRPTPTGGQVHGGVHQAVYAFPSEHFPHVEAIVGGPVGPGYMGENLTLRGALEDGVCIGDVWRWGSALLQITAPRGPCYKLGIRMGRQGMRTAIREHGLVGWYLRVLEPGPVPTRGTIAVEHRDPAGITVGEIHRALQDRGRVHPQLAGLAALSPGVRHALMVRDRDLSGGVPERD